MKWVLILLCFSSLFAAENLVAQQGSGDRVSSAQITLSKRDQDILCEEFLGHRGFLDLKEKFESYGTTIEDSYHQVKCEDGREDLLKYRQMNYSGRSDIAAFILYYRRDLGREDELPGLFNIVVAGPKIPHGTLLDFIQYYHDMDDLNAYGKEEYERMMVMLRRFGAKTESEL